MTLEQWWDGRWGFLRWPLNRGPESPRFFADGIAPGSILPEPEWGNAESCESVWQGAFTSEPCYPFTALTFPL